MKPINAAYPFALWGMDILGIFLKAKGQVRHVVVIIDYFTKWIEAKTLTDLIVHTYCASNMSHPSFWPTVI